MDRNWNVYIQVVCMHIYPPPHHHHSSMTGDIGIFILHSWLCFSRRLADEMPVTWGPIDTPSATDIYTNIHVFIILVIIFVSSLSLSHPGLLHSQGDVTFTCAESVTVAVTFHGPRSFLQLPTTASSSTGVSVGFHFRTWNKAGLLLTFNLPEHGGVVWLYLSDARLRLQIRQGGRTLLELRAGGTETYNIQHCAMYWSNSFMCNAQFCIGENLWDVSQVLLWVTVSGIQWIWPPDTAVWASLWIKKKVALLTPHHHFLSPQEVSSSLEVWMNHLTWTHKHSV